VADQTDVETLIGAKFDDPAVQALLARYDARAEVEEEDGKISWVSRAAGLELSADAPTRRVTAVFTYGPAAKRHKAYTGVLPGDARTTLSRDELRDRFGPPDKTDDDFDFWPRGDYDISVEYRGAGVVETFTLMT
jgi:hypothetical protein